MRNKCKKGLHEYVEINKTLETYQYGTIVKPGLRKCVYCGKIKE
jgi:hypothetical protein